MKMKTIYFCLVFGFWKKRRKWKVSSNLFFWSSNRRIKNAWENLNSMQLSQIVVLLDGMEILVFSSEKLMIYYCFLISLGKWLILSLSSLQKWKGMKNGLPVNLSFFLSKWMGYLVCSFDALAIILFCL